MNILIVDDSEHFRESVSDALRNEQDRITAVATGYDALSVIAECDIDLLVTDIEMPGLDGYQLTQIARGLDIQVIVMSGNNSQIEEAQSEVFGAVACVVKDKNLTESIKHIIRSIKDK
jgi:CheY-like chemotaxis protein